MKRFDTRPFLAIAAAAMLPFTAACSKVEEGDTPSSNAEEAEVSGTLAEALGDADDLSTLEDAIATAELGTVFDGPGSYTLLAPTDAAFDALGEQREALMQEDQRPVLTAILRNHILPGHLTTDAIAKAIADKGGPVTVTTLGDGRAVFAQDGDNITVTNEHGSEAVLGTAGTPSTNGVILPIGAVLMPPKEA